MTTPRAARRGRVVRRIWAACLLVAGLNHAAILLRHGLAWDYHGAHRASAAYWSALTMVDPLVALLLLVRPRLGVPLAVLLIATNVVHNLAVAAWAVPSDRFVAYLLSAWQVQAQIVFLVFVLATWRIAAPGPARDRRG